MFAKFKTAIIVFFAIIFVGGLGAVAVLTAFRQNTTKPVAPTVPQITPRAAEPTTPACTASFTVVTGQTLFCDSLSVNPGSGTFPLNVELKVAGRTTGVAITAYNFDFGDGTTVVSQNGNTVSHSYAKAGTFTAKGYVVDNTGNVIGGNGECQKTVTVSPSTYKYKTCENNACKEEDCKPNNIPCPGLNSCSSDTDCKTFTYRSCEGNACVSHPCNPSNKSCDQLISCQTNFDCRTITYKHNVCLGTACSLVECSPATAPCDSTCKNNTDCGAVTPTHKECRNNACTVVNGTGADSCTSDVSCQPQAVAPPIPKSGSTEITIGGIALGIGAILVGLLLTL